MQGMKNKKGIAAVAAILAICMAFCLIYKPVYYRLYPGDRIRGDIQVIVDGQTYALTESSFSDSGKVTSKDDGSANVRIKAGEYGAYEFVMDADAVGQPVTIRCYQYNWWNVMDFDLQLHVDTQQNIATVSGSVITIADNGSKINDTIYCEYDLTDNIKVSFGL